MDVELIVLLCFEQVGSLCNRLQNLIASVAPQFQPECTDDGRFARKQCFGGYCWCVDVVSGQPVSDGVEEGEADDLQCTGCMRIGDEEDSEDSEVTDDEGEEISVGDSYSTEDGCNTW